VKHIKHDPIDYNKWNPDGSGSNIIKLLTPEEIGIWDTALKYQDKGDDPGHAECVTYFALRFLDYTKAERAIVIPAAMLHDAGWGLMTKEELDSFRGSLVNPDIERRLRLKHEEQGSIFAERLLHEIRYPQRYIKPICEIVDGHDTRKGFLSAEDGFVRDADKLWRYTLMHLKIYGGVPGAPTSKEDLARLIKKPGFFYSEAVREIARIELEHTFKVHAVAGNGE